VQPEIDVLGLPLKTFGLMLALGFLASGAVVSRHLRELGKPADWAYEMIFAALIGGLVGAKVYWAIDNTGEGGSLFSNLFSGTGLTWYGGALGGAAAVLFWGWRRGMFNRTVLDLASVPLAIGYAVGRIGCQISGDGDYGTAWDGPWAMAYPDGAVPTDVPVHPAPIYETLAMGLAAYAIWRMRHVVRPGVMFGAYLVLAGTERLLVEFVRRNDEVLAGLTMAQLWSLAMMAGGAAFLWVLARRGGLRVPVAGGRRVPATA
jgi:phosphatidylglycerol---prolipoprotein diacylglyceryl transferase